MNGFAEVFEAILGNFARGDGTYLFYPLASQQTNNYCRLEASFSIIQA